ncbi:MAG: GPR endopeptidase [Clostridiales bacterium]|jgi:spore protease|nr:GPR endopeptidase [Clostridiales bacterium]
MEQTAFSVRTDLALESVENQEVTDDSGVGVEEEEYGDIKVTWVQVRDKRGAQSMGKPVGSYITIESEAMKEHDVETHEKIADILSKQLEKLAKLKPDAAVLVVGLGNWNVTPDALGPKVVSKILVTRHLSGEMPTELMGRVRSVSAISPGVMGLTGIETGEIIKGVVERVKPDLVIAIDALAARRTKRINATVQLSDTGINPGAGVGNNRMKLNAQSLGVPTVVVGIPTVVDAATLVNDTMDSMLNAMVEQAPRGTEFFSMLKSLAGEEKYHLISEILNPYTGNMFVTPKEVDAVIERLSGIIANGINIALHPGVTSDDMNRFMAI